MDRLFIAKHWVNTPPLGAYPYAINLAGNGKWVSAYIELPDAYDAGDILAGSVTLTVNGNFSLPDHPSRLPADACLLKR